MKFKKYIVLLIIFLCALFYTTSEGFLSKFSKFWIPGTSTCRQRTSCSSCLNNGYDSTGALCYWCKSNGCINPDDKKDAKYFNNSCSTDKKCNV